LISEITKPENRTAALIRGEIQLEDGWFSPLSGYQYKATPNEQSWEESRSICQSWGGDLIVYGVRNASIKV